MSESEKQNEEDRAEADQFGQAVARQAKSAAPGEAVVLGLFEDKRIDPEESRLFVAPELRAAISRRECTGEKDNLVEAFILEGDRSVRVYVMGLGPREKFDPRALRK